MTGAPRIPLCIPLLAGNEARYLNECVETNFVSSVGPFVDRFETTMAETLGARHAVATSSGTAALHVALLVAGVRPGDLVLVSSLTFIAPANAIRYVGADPMFVDADAATWQIDVNLVSQFFATRCERRGGETVDKKSGRRIGAILPVDILGHPVDADPLLDLARTHGVPVIEDATESLGGRYKGRPAAMLGDIACLSFNGNKLMTSGGGGMIVTDNADWARRARHLTTQAKADPRESIHDEIGFNYRLTNIQAALGVAQLERLKALVAAKRRVAARYQDLCGAVPGLSFMPEATWAESAYWLSTVLVDPVLFGMDSRSLQGCLAEKGIETRPLWQPLHLSPAHRGADVLGGSVAENLWSRALSLPSSAGIERSELDAVCAAITGARQG